MPSLAHVPHLPPRRGRDDSMGMPQAARRYTVEEVLAVPVDGNRPRRTVEPYESQRCGVTVATGPQHHA